jgi:2-oxoisovalerate dehydrogenase E2 component (dihydrolipoyl transacylase)
MARLDFKLPDIGEGITEAEIVEWHAGVGDAVKEGQVIASVMTDKATIEMEAPADGTLLFKGGEIGETLAVGAVLFALETTAGLPETHVGSGEARAEVERPPLPPRVPGTPEGPASGGHRAERTLAAPAVRRRAKLLGIDLAQIPSAGERVLHEDLDRFLLGTRQVSEPGSMHSHTAEARRANANEIPLIGMRRQIARRMQEAKRHIAHFTYVDEVDVTRLEQLRQSLNAAHPEEPALHLLPFLCVAACRALKLFPSLNAHYDDEREVMTLFDEVHLGIATQTDEGLLVPVLRDADRLDARQIAREISDLAHRARTGKLGRDELRGSTFTISSLGKLGGIVATPIVNRPEVAILAPNRIVERIAMTSTGSAPRMIMNLSLSCDHRIIDGYVAASFVQEVKRLLESQQSS